MYYAMRKGPETRSPETSTQVLLPVNDDEYPEWQEGYLAEIYLSSERDEDF